MVSEFSGSIFPENLWIFQDTGALLFGTRFSEAFPAAPCHAATPHRVVARTSGSTRPRLSVAFFLAREK
jgi:hypothetical protein